MPRGGPLPGSGRGDNRARQSRRLGRQATTSALLCRFCVVARTVRPRQPGPPRPPPAPCPQGLAWMARRERPGRDGAPGAWKVARRSLAGHRTTRRNGYSVGSRCGIAGMEPAARSWSPCPPSPLRTSSHFTLGFDSICAPQPSKEVGYLVTKKSLYAGPIGIPTASPAPSIIWWFAGTSRGRYCHVLSTAMGWIPTVLISTDRIPTVQEPGGLQVFRFLSDSCGRYGRYSD
jgi:hypothetical protein